MQGAPKRQVNAQVNAEDMLAELKRALETSTPAPDAPVRAASTAAKPRSPGPETRRLQIGSGSDRPAKANAKQAIGRRADLQKPTRPRGRSWKLIAGGVALAGAAIIGVSFALMNKAPDLAEREPSVAATASVVKPQNEQTVEPANAPRAPMQDSPQAAPSQAGDLLVTPPAAPTFAPAPLNQGATLVTTHRIRPDGTPIATAPSPPASPDSAPPLTEAPKTAAPSAVSQVTRPDGTPIASAPPTPASPVSTPPVAEAPKTAAPSAVSQAAKPDGTPIASAPSTPASTQSAPLAERPKPDATPTASKESAELSKADSQKKPLVKTARQRLLGSPKPPVKPIAQAERQSTEPAPPKEAEKSPQPAQDAGGPPAAAPVKTTSVQQRVADGVTHAFGYLVHLPGALVPHFGGPNPDAH
jgi:hypothetical protein